jgi:1,4-dihydroxy-2-naphthoyl-CoA hydrolase
MSAERASVSDTPHPGSMVTPETVRDFLPGSFPGDLGIEPLEIEDSHSRGRIVVDKRHLHPGGFVHGGVWTALGDTVAAWATFRNIPPRHNFTTIELKLNVFAAGLLGDEIVAVAEPLHTGKSTVVIEVRMERRREGVEPRLAANLIVSQFVLPPAGA